MIVYLLHLLLRRNVNERKLPSQLNPRPNRLGDRLQPGSGYVHMWMRRLRLGKRLLARSILQEYDASTVDKVAVNLANQSGTISLKPCVWIAERGRCKYRELLET